MPISLKTAFSYYRDEWNRRGATYSRAARAFQRAMRFLLHRGTVPTAQQFDGLYRILRWDGQCGPAAKLEVLKAAFPGAVLRDIEADIWRGTGCYGGGLGSVAPQLRSQSARARLWAVMKTVGTAGAVDVADAALAQYALKPVKGIGTNTLSTFLWALQRKWYPVVNDGSRNGLRGAIEGFKATKEIGEYVRRQVPRCRQIATDLNFRTFSNFDVFFHALDRGGYALRREDKIPFTTAEEREQEDRDLEILEGRKREFRGKSVERNARARRIALERGYDCEVCGFSFERVYGTKFAEVHHIRPLGRGGIRKVDPDKHLVVVCSNCHSMLHPAPGKTVNWTVLRARVERRRGCAT